MLGLSFVAQTSLKKSRLHKQKIKIKINAGNPLQSGNHRLSNKDNILNSKARMKHNGEKEIGTFLIARRWRML